MRRILKYRILHDDLLSNVIRKQSHAHLTKNESNTMDPGLHSRTSGDDVGLLHSSLHAASPVRIPRSLPSDISRSHSSANMSDRARRPGS